MFGSKLVKNGFNSPFDDLGLFSAFSYEFSWLTSASF